MWTKTAQVSKGQEIYSELFTGEKATGKVIAKAKTRHGAALMVKYPVEVVAKEKQEKHAQLLKTTFPKSLGSRDDLQFVAVHLGDVYLLDAQILTDPHIIREDPTPMLTGEDPRLTLTWQEEHEEKAEDALKPADTGSAHIHNPTIRTPRMRLPEFTDKIIEKDEVGCEDSAILQEDHVYSAFKLSSPQS